MTSYRQIVTKLPVYQSRHNTAGIMLNTWVNGVETPTDFSNITRMILTLNPNDAAPVTVDTQTDPGAIDYSNPGVILFDIGALPQIEAMSEGEYDCRLTGIDGPGDPHEFLNEDSLLSKVIFRINATSTV